MHSARAADNPIRSYCIPRAYVFMKAMCSTVKLHTHAQTNTVHARRLIRGQPIRTVHTGRPSLFPTHPRTPGLGRPFASPPHQAYMTHPQRDTHAHTHTHRHARRHLQTQTYNVYQANRPTTVPGPIDPSSPTHPRTPGSQRGL